MTGNKKGLNRVEIGRLTGLYHLEAYLFEEVSKRFAEEQTLTPFGFFAIIIWKSNRVKTKVKKGLDAAGQSVQTLMRKVARADNPVDKVEILTDVEGIGIRVA